MGVTYPGGRRFAFTIMDDTDVATVANVRPVYRLLADLGFRTTKTVWPVGCPEGSPNFGSSETLEDPAYLAFVLELATEGFEVAYHGATMESSTRARTDLALRRFKELFGGSPRVYANHAYNKENLYWGGARIDDRVLRWIYTRTEGRDADFYQGHVPGTPWWWGDLSRSISYARNLTFANIDTLAVNPSMPYRDPHRPAIDWWFSASDAEDVHAFNHLLRPEAQDRLERDGGVSIVATHLGKGFASGGSVHPVTRQLLERLAAKGGWYVPVVEILDWLRKRHAGSGVLPPAEWRSMQWRWAWDLLLRQLRRRFA